MPTPSKKQLIAVEVKRNGSGCYLHLKSDFDWACLRSANGSKVTIVGNDTRCYRMAPINVPGIPSFTSNSNQARLYPSENSANMTFLAAEGIEEGVVFKLEGPHSLDVMQRYVAEIRKVAKHVYADRMKPINVAVTLTVEETEIL